MDSQTLEAYLGNILDAITRIRKYVARVSKEDFLKEDSMVAAAVVRELEIIGEAISQLPEEFKNQQEAIPWRKIVDMRNRLIHGYFSVDYEMVWQTVQEDLGDFKKEIETLLEKQPR